MKPSKALSTWLFLITCFVLLNACGHTPNDRDVLLVEDSEDVLPIPQVADISFNYQHHALLFGRYFIQYNGHDVSKNAEITLTALNADAKIPTVVLRPGQLGQGAYVYAVVDPNTDYMVTDVRVVHQLKEKKKIEKLRLTLRQKHVRLRSGPIASAIYFGSVQLQIMPEMRLPASGHSSGELQTVGDDLWTYDVEQDWPSARDFWNTTIKIKDVDHYSRSAEVLLPKQHRVQRKIATDRKQIQLGF